MERKYKIYDRKWTLKVLLKLDQEKYYQGLVKRIDKNVKVNAINNEEDINIIKNL